ncbi:FAD/NAD(P)-binding protein [Alteromonas macleodii]|uniref:FAD-NAD(P)-binding n=1 Tax=Alteromonas macleodii TaxID=28108 RepID=A0A6T9Y6L7_ALTMA|nr:FAD/NAD(P)-binding protein [Alteromonas macleodii]CAB9495361.1 FAD-NAD(P)-binding [Alteromonas macleodii]
MIVMENSFHQDCVQKNIAIIGAGPTTLYFLCELLEKNVFPQTIVIFEKHAEPGKGTPFRNENASPNLLSNLKENEIPKLNVSFSAWLHEIYGEDLVPTTLKTFLSCADYPEEAANKVIPRAVLGEYLGFCFNRAIQSLKQKGLDVTVKLHTEVKSIALENHRFTVDTSKERCSGFDRVVVNMGGDLCAKEKLDDALWAYPPKQYTHEDASKFTIDGMSLTAIDAALSIARTKGQFYDSANGIEYRTKHDFQIVMRSRSGVFPKVWYNSDTVTDYKKILNADCAIDVSNVESFFRHKLLPLFKQSMPKIYHQIKNMSFTESLTFLNQRNEQSHPILKLKAELLSLADESRQSDWPAVIAAGIDYIQQSPLLLKDFLTQHQDIKSQLSASFASIPLESANRIIALYDSKVLTFEQAEDAKLEEDSNADGIKINAKGIIECEDKLAKLKDLLTFSGKNYERGAYTNGDEWSVAENHELLINGKSTQLYVGSAFVTPWYINIPGLGTCADFGKQIAHHCVQTDAYEEAVGE